VTYPPPGEARRSAHVGGEPDPRRFQIEYPRILPIAGELVGVIERPPDTVDSMVTADRVTRRVDTIIAATGFEAGRFLSAIEVAGRGGKRLDDAWAGGAEAYLGITTSGFQNVFMLYGPNTNNGSILTMLEG
jgi:hypothetical protein